ncbi:5-hydroxytryptamine receptor 3A-like [Solea solea]|uniref:5-hydroxytryptamine receptor 3A-like n=1 Tax=Solea solea TaxID=90069 RepID=UPI00272D31F9|nr:5-hydroxytryptamine receptor 3A-like [Solea solea]XP_058510392.1 5-hydroxytryptamine receptor 3A-like [Solea solea]XP_058510393.1 5-hydroxytryptamine receptor 3A-like [Solea solea]
MPSGTFIHHGLTQAALLLWLVGCGHAESSCRDRRCLAQMLISKEYVSQPQYENCSQVIRVPYLEYQTITVDTKNLRLISKITAYIEWRDPGLMWNMSDYNYKEVTLPVDKVWTPELHVANGIMTTMTHASHDLTVRFDGMVYHIVIINAEVNCDVNMFNYPFATDTCPVAIQTSERAGECGTELELLYVWPTGKTRGDWKTESVVLGSQGYGDTHYIMVSLKIQYTNPFITLLLPSILIVLADVVSFSLPLQGGERNSFKVTLVLSFTMFLNILNEKLPGDGECSPIIRIHFCICLVLMVLSMLVSLVLTRVAKDGGIRLCCFSKKVEPKTARSMEDNVDEEIKPDISVIQLDGPEEEKQILRKVVKFLENFQAKDMENESYQRFADTLDKTFFWIYFFVAVSYFCAMTTVMVMYTCSVNHFFWHNDDANF